MQTLRLLVRAEQLRLFSGGPTTHVDGHVRRTPTGIAPVKPHERHVEHHATAGDHAEMIKQLRSHGTAAAKALATRGEALTDPAEQVRFADEARTLIKNVWAYDEYSDWSRALARQHTRKELEERMHGSAHAQVKASASHLRAVERSHSMQGNSQARAQTGNVVRGNYEERNALKNAIEIYDKYPQHTREHDPNAAPIRTAHAYSVEAEDACAIKYRIDHVSAYEVISPSGKGNTKWVNRWYDKETGKEKWHTGHPSLKAASTSAIGTSKPLSRIGKGHADP